jgi:cephalosporin-C deacetylase-like acetyl esterase
MPTRLTCTLLGLAFCAARASAQTAPPAHVFTVLPEVPAGPRITPFLEHQLDLAWEQDETRRARFASVRTEEDLASLQREIRSKLLALLGGLPSERTPLNARVVGTIPMDGYRIEKVIFESLPGVHVTALLYLPDGETTTPRPAVLVACGHAPDGKSFKNYQELSGQLARRGYVVLCWDPVGQGERSQFWDAAQKKSRYNLVCGEHAVLGNLACLAGTSLNRYMIWDGMRALDYLLTRKEVDGVRISVTGTSGGGFQSLYLAALDERIRVAAPSCFVTALPMRMANRIFEDPDSDPEQDPFGLVSDGIDHAGLLLLIHPRPVIVAAAVKDFFPIEGTRQTVREVRALYERLGHGDRIALAQGVHGHMFSPENREAAFAFLDRFNGLKGRSGLDAVRILPPDELRCTLRGQVRVDLPGRSLPEVIRADFQALEASDSLTGTRLADVYRGAGDPGVASWRIADGSRNGPPARREILWDAVGHEVIGGVRVDRYRLRHSGPLVLPLLHMRREGRRPRATVLDLGLNGKMGPAEWTEMLALVEGGHDVLSFDARGLGETAMRYRADSIDDKTIAPKDAAAAYTSPVSGVLANHVYNALLTGRPYLFGMIEDAEIVARFARSQLGVSSLAVRPRGEATAWAEAVASLLPDSTLVRTEARPFVFSEVVDQMRELWPIHYLVPRGALLDAGRRTAR